MDRTRSRRGALTRHMVLDAALGLIDRHGLDSLTIRGLARELGVPPMTLYAHFGSKQELLDLAFERLLGRLFTDSFDSGATTRAAPIERSPRQDGVTFRTVPRSRTESSWP